MLPVTQTGRASRGTGLRAGVEGGAAQGGSDWRWWLCDQGGCVLKVSSELCPPSRAWADTVEGMRPLAAGSELKHSYGSAAGASVFSVADRPSAQGKCREKVLAVGFPRHPVGNVC